MSIKFRNNCKVSDFQEDYHKIRSFLLKLNNPNFLFGRWDWMITQLWLDKSGLPKIGLWEDNDEIVALATYDCQLGRSYFLVYDEYSFLKKEMLVYSKDAFQQNGEYRALINDTDIYFQDIAAKMGFVATDEREHDAVYYINAETIKYTLPEGFRLTSFDKDYEIVKAGIDLTEEGKTVEEWELMWLRPNVDLSLKISVISPKGEDVCNCGMWFDKESEYALVEPVGTSDEYQGLGLARAAVLEGIKRCGLLGAKKAFVGSSMQFYYNLGFYPYSTSTWWKQR